MDTATLIGLVAVIIAINAAFMTASFFYYERKSKLNDTQITELKSSNDRLSAVVDSLILGLVIDDVRETTYESVLERLLSATNHGDETKARILSAFALNSMESSRAINELMLYSEDGQVKLAAFRQLSEICGSVESIEKMVSAKEFEPANDIDIYSECIKVLIQRLNVENSLKTNRQ